MVKFQPSALIDKYKHSKDNWILAIPVYDNQELKLRCYMSRKNKDFFENVYTYKISMPLLKIFFEQKSIGQAYHMFIREKEPQIHFLSEAKHEKGIFLLDDIETQMFIGKTAYICSILQNEFERDGFDFSIEAITQQDRKNKVQLEKEAKKRKNEELQQQLKDLEKI